MKINTINGQQIPAKPASGPEGTSSGNDFRKLLDDRLQSISESKKIAAAEGIEKARQNVSPELRMDGLGLTEAVIDNLEEFSAVLDRKDLAAADLEPFIANLEEETYGLLTIKDQLPADDPLKGLLEKVATVSYLETAKFRRGDYGV